jgi:hypothetical protein
MSSFKVLFPAFALAAGCALFGCSETPGPPLGDSGDGLGDFQGQIDPGSESMVFKTLDVPIADGVPIRVQLVGRFVRCRDDARCAPVPDGVALVVAVRNIDYRTLYAPGEIILSDFNPASTYPYPGSPDWTTCPFDSIPDAANIALLDCIYGFAYSDLLGPDGALTPGETSGEKLWIFTNPGGGSFSFAARARFALGQDAPVIAGRFFSDDNENGIRDPDEGPFGGGSVQVSGPGIEQTVQVGEDASYSVRVKEQGLYTLLAIAPPTFGFAPVKFTTPNPLEVLIVNNESFLHADFGLANDFFGPYPPVLFSETGDSLRMDAYHLQGVRLAGHILFLDVAFSGCGPDHPLQLFMVGGFMESFPVQARLVLSHNDGGELCHAYWQRELGFDVSPILRRNNGGTVILRFVDWHGETHSFELSP